MSKNPKKSRKQNRPVVAKSGSQRTGSKQHVTRSISESLVASQFQGPIPPPELLAGYDDVVPGAADRIIALAEKETAHRHEMEKKVLDAEVKVISNEAREIFLGQIFAFLIGTTTVLAGVYAAVHGAQITGSLIGTSGVVGLVSVFILGRKNSDSSIDNQSTKDVQKTKNSR
ncbi:MAG: DUF2335 domain-containing protein [Desulfobacteraceae bacterium]|nr:DUF2335 domain-containing protein [Desulfobacteraceae bacterium]